MNWRASCRYRLSRPQLLRHDPPDLWRRLQPKLYREPEQAPADVAGRASAVRTYLAEGVSYPPIGIAGIFLLRRPLSTVLTTVVFGESR